jgi:hypothetical protein
MEIYGTLSVSASREILERMNVNYSSQCLRTATMGAGKTGDGNRSFDRIYRIYRINSNRMDRMDRMGVFAHGHHKDGNRGEFNHKGVCTRVFPHGGVCTRPLFGRERGTPGARLRWQLRRGALQGKTEFQQSEGTRPTAEVLVDGHHSEGKRGAFNHIPRVRMRVNLRRRRCG